MCESVCMLQVFYEMKKGTMRGKNTLGGRKTSKGG